MLCALRGWRMKHLFDLQLMSGWLPEGTGYWQMHVLRSIEFDRSYSSAEVSLLLQYLCIQP